MPISPKPRRGAPRGASGRGGAAGRTPIVDDPNIAAAALLYDMAALHASERSRIGYKRAAAAIVALPASVVQLVESGALEDVSLIGPSSTRILTEFVLHGRSAMVDAAFAASPRRDEVLRARELRSNFLSEYAKGRVLSMRLPGPVVGLSSYRGDLQMHSRWSDGAETVQAMAEACLALGRSRMGITDHSHGLPVAKGMSMAAARQQGLEVDALNDRYAGRFRIFKGVEANIRADGSLDLEPEERRAFEYVVAAPHALLRREDDQTARMLAAVRAPGVAILGHPRGRMYGRRPGVRADWPRVFAAAAERQIAIELDGNWHRQDLDWELAARAVEAGCILALDSDAHSVSELRFAEYAIAHARVVRTPAERVINYWSDERLDAWMRERRGS
jgi:putative hydrolase